MSCYLELPSQQATCHFCRHLEGQFMSRQLLGTDGCLHRSMKQRALSFVTTIIIIIIISVILNPSFVFQLIIGRGKELRSFPATFLYKLWCVSVDIRHYADTPRLTQFLKRKKVK